MYPRATPSHQVETVSVDTELLLTTETGRELGQALRRALARTAPGAVVVADLRRVQHAGYRALHEVLAAVAAAHAELEYRYLLIWIDRDNEELLASLTAAAVERGTALPLLLYPEGLAGTVGKLTKSERDTLDLVERSGTLTAASLRTQIDVGASSASNRLRRLYRLRLVRRQERIVAESGGREFIYEALVTGAASSDGAPRWQMEETPSRSAR
jgi:hypothetical protein